MRNYRTGLLRATRFAHLSLFSAGRLASSSTGPSCPGEVSFAHYVTLPTPSPCTRLSRARSTMSRSDSPTASGYPHDIAQVRFPGRRGFRFRFVIGSGFPLAFFDNRIPYLSTPGADGASRVLDASLPACQALATPTGPRESHHAETLGRCSFSPFSAWFPGSATISRPWFRLSFPLYWLPAS